MCRPHDGTGSDLAEVSGVTEVDIIRIERGQVAPTTQTLLKLTDALGGEIQFVLTEPGSAPIEPTSAVDRSANSVSSWPRTAS